MANIAQYLNDIDNAIYGKDVINGIKNLANVLNNEQSTIRSNIADLQTTIHGIKKADGYCLNIVNGLPGGWEFTELKCDIEPYIIDGPLDDQGNPYPPSVDNQRNIIQNSNIIGIRRSGKNILQKPVESGQHIKGNLIYDFLNNGSVHITGNRGSVSNDYYIDYLATSGGAKPLPRNVPLKLLGGNSNIEVSVTYRLRQGEPSTVLKTAGTSKSSEPTVFIIPNNAYNVGMRIFVRTYDQVDEMIYPRIYLADEITNDWIEYSGEMYSISLPSNSHIYRGYITLNPRYSFITITKTHEFYEFDGSEDENWYISSSTNPNGTLFGIDLELNDGDRPVFKTYNDLSEWKVLDSGRFCNMESEATIISTSGANGWYWTTDGKKLRFLYGEPNGGTDVATLKNFLNSHSLQILGRGYDGVDYLIDPIPFNTIPVEQTILFSHGQMHSRYFAIPYPKEANS